MTSQVMTVTVTHSDVLYVVHQIKKDLLALSTAYPSLLDKDRVYKCHEEACTFIMNNAVTCFWYTIDDPAESRLVYHQLRYEISYAGDGPRTGLGGAAMEKQVLPPTAVFSEAVTWSPTMRALPVAKQKEILEGTKWGLPGTTGSVEFTYKQGNWQDRGRYASGALSAHAREYKGR